MIPSERNHTEQIIEGMKNTITKKNELISRLTKERDQLRKELGLLEETGYVEEPSLPPIIIGAGYGASPVCSKHGAMIRYKHDIWRCEACKTSVALKAAELYPTRV
jgi:hypothetical protein